MISDIPITRPRLACLLLAGHSAADLVTLAGGSSRLTGTVHSIDGNGSVVLATELSAEPLLLKGGTVDRIEFSHRQSAADSPTTLIELANGDIIPAEIESLDNDRFAILSADAGRLVIPRHSIHSIQTGIRQRSLVYQGPNGPAEWSTQGTNRKIWTFEEKSMIANGPATASQDLELPRQFIMRFTLVWQNGKVPNFKVYFADPLSDHNEADDRYYLQFASAGLEIKREAAKGKRYNTLLILNRSHTSYTDNRLNVELRVNRDTARIELLLNGESEGEIADPIPLPPRGTGIAFVLNHRENSSQEIRNIEVLEYDDSRARHRAEDRGDGSTDSLITRDDSRWSGILGNIRKSGDELIYLFKGDKQEEFMEIPEREVSTVFIAGNSQPPAPAAVHSSVLRLAPQGSLSVSTCVFDDDVVTAEHPLLGTLTLRRGGIIAMERIHPEAPAEP